MSGYYSDYEHPWKGVIQSLMMLVVIALCVGGGIAIINGMILGDLSLWLIPVLILMFAVICLFSYGLVNMWVMYFKWKKEKNE